MDNANHSFISDEPVLKFRTGAAMPSRLGSEQLKDEITAVIELVKNSYDADATAAHVEFLEIEGGIKIRIRDDGSGMSTEDLRTKWFWLGTENKLKENRSPLFMRRRLGQKGVGRFAAEKLGRMLVLRTRTKGEETVRQISIAWDQLSGEKELNEYSFPLKHKKPKSFESDHGTCLTIGGLHINWTKSKTEKLRQLLCRLIDPEVATTDFRIFFLRPGKT